MESLKKSLLTLTKGFSIWIILLIFNTRDGEAIVNTIKIVLDVIIAVILVGNYKKEKLIVLIGFFLTVFETNMRLTTVFEILLLTCIVIIEIILLKSSSETTSKHESDYQNSYKDFSFINANKYIWNTRNIFCPFEKYSYNADSGIHIQKGLFKRSYISIPTNNIRIRIDQSIMQHILGLCEISFQSNYTGQSFGEEKLRNVRYKMAAELADKLH